MIPLTRGPRRSQIVKTGSGSVVAGAGGGNASWCLMGTEFQSRKFMLCGVCLKPQFLIFIILFYFLLFRASSMAYGGSQARG